MSQSNNPLCVTCTAPVNIAVIKYWGKRDEELILPLNSSLSGTLNQADLKTTTTVMASPDFTEDELWLNGTKEDINNVRLQNCFRAIRARAQQQIENNPLSETATDEEKARYQMIKNGYKVRVSSINNFPTAAGLASSASGYCCLVFALGQLYGVQGDLSTIARIGSGSACRSMYGGFVAWEMGKRDDGEDSRAVQVQPESHWPEMQVLVFVVNDRKKSVSSSSGMGTSVKTSKLMKPRVETIVPERMAAIERAIAERDFATFGDITMKDSDDFHAVCADTIPPIFYLNDTSRAVIALVHKYNEKSGTVKAAYTFDAGPNAVIYLPKENLKEFLALSLTAFPPATTDASYFKGRDSQVFEDAKAFASAGLADDLKSIVTDGTVAPVEDAFRYIIHTDIGPGPQVLTNPAEHLIDPVTGACRV